MKNDNARRGARPQTKRPSGPTKIIQTDDQTPTQRTARGERRPSTTRAPAARSHATSNRASDSQTPANARATATPRNSEPSRTAARPGKPSNSATARPAASIRSASTTALPAERPLTKRQTNHASASSSSRDSSPKKATPIVTNNLAPQSEFKFIGRETARTSTKARRWDDVLKQANPTPNVCKKSSRARVLFRAAKPKN